MHKHTLHEEEKGSTVLTTKRLEGLQDAFFAIVLTLLVLELHIPEISTAQELRHQLFEQWPMFFGYFISFLNLGIYWVSQHHQFHYINKSDRILLWINLLFLLFVSLIPFTTGLLAENGDIQLPYIIYGLNLIVIGLLSAIQWWYASHHHRLTSHGLRKEVRHSVMRRTLVAPLVALLAILVSYLSTSLSLAMYLLLPAYYLWPNKVDEFWWQPAVPHDD